MTSRVEGCLFLAAMLVSSLFFQVHSKILADHVSGMFDRSGDSLSGLLQLATQDGLLSQLIIVGCLAGLTFLLWFLALTRLDLSMAMPLTAVGLLVNTFAAGIMLGETLTLSRITGAVIVTIGLMLVLRS